MASARVLRGQKPISVPLAFNECLQPSFSLEDAKLTARELRRAITESDSKEDLVSVLKEDVVSVLEKTVFAHQDWDPSCMDHVAILLEELAAGSTSTEHGPACFNIVQDILVHLLLYSQNKEAHSRCRALLCIRKIMDRMARNGKELADDLADALSAGLINRLIDKDAKVRYMAVFAMHRLIIADDKGSHAEDLIVEAYTELLERERTLAVRKAVIECISYDSDTVELILERTCDVSHEEGAQKKSGALEGPLPWSA
eukprot:gene8900-3786_t